MGKEQLKEITEDILKVADIKINGSRSWDIKVNDDRFYNKVLSQGSLGLGESYMDGWWDCESLDQFFYRIFINNLDGNAAKGIRSLMMIAKAKLLNLQTNRRAFQIGERHYDIGNDLFRNMLDKRLVYSCGYWKKARNLEKAQEAKLDLICKKLGLKPGQKILDIGCGWGSFVKYAAEKYKVKAVGITVSKKQAELAKNLCKGLPIEIRLQDYRQLDEKFDHIVSIGMFEHVGSKNYREFMRVVNNCLDDNGLFLLHTIGSLRSGSNADPWTAKYIFPNSRLPNSIDIINASNKLFIVEDWHNFGADYDRTLMAWHKNFNDNWDKIKDKYGNRFYRMWNYYLLAYAGSFRARKNQLWQIVFSKNGVKDGYESVR